MTRPEAPFQAPWQAQAFALVAALIEGGALAPAHWAEVLGARRAQSQGNGGGDYWQDWLTALEDVVVARGLGDEMAALRDAWSDAHASTRHGQPVELAHRAD